MYVNDPPKMPMKKKKTKKKSTIHNHRRLKKNLPINIALKLHCSQIEALRLLHY